MKTEVLSAQEPGTVDRAATLLREGQVVALPTETVYGLAADATREDAILRIFQAKSRPRFDPLIVHLPDAGWVDRLVKIEDTVRDCFSELRKRFWPGPLTFVFPRRSIIGDMVTAGLETVAIRLSSHPVFSEVARIFGRPIAAPSANRFGRISPTTAEHVRDELDGLIPLIVDAGPSSHGLESTIVALRHSRIEVLRRGPITAEQLAQFGEVAVIRPSLHPEAPGQLPSHYAPKTPLTLVNDAEAFACPAGKRCGLLGWKTRSSENFAVTRCLSVEQSLTEAATNLFGFLRELDGQGLDLIVAEKLPDEGLGAAINDRLGRAATKL